MMFDLDALSAIVLKGQRVKRGMPDFGSMYNADDLRAIHHFVRMKARASLKAAKAKAQASR